MLWNRDSGKVSPSITAEKVHSNHSSSAVSILIAGLLGKSCGGRKKLIAGIVNGFCPPVFEATESD
jgi:hypothetical protein